MRKSKIILQHNSILVILNKMMGKTVRYI